MKTSELIKILKKGGCKLIEHGTRHDIWFNPRTGATTTVGRHKGKEIAKGTANEIMKQMDLK